MKAVVSILVRFVKRNEPKVYHERELRSCVKVELAVLGSPSLVVFVVSVDVEQP